MVIKVTGVSKRDDDQWKMFNALLGTSPITGQSRVHWKKTQWGQRWGSKSPEGV